MLSEWVQELQAVESSGADLDERGELRVEDHGETLRLAITLRLDDGRSVSLLVDGVPEVP